MAGAVHGSWCRARTWLTRCPTCGHRVYFFMCNCGSKVFFDDLGDPWPRHDCDTSWTRGIRRTVDPSGRVTAHLSSGVSVTRPPEDFSVDERVIARARTPKRREAAEPIIAVDPKGDATCEITGVLRELTRSAKPLKAFGFDERDMGYALLGVIGAQPVGRITVHVPKDDSSQLQSYTAWIPSALIKDARINTGITVSIRAQGVPIAGKDYVWYCEDFTVIG